MRIQLAVLAAALLLPYIPATAHDIRARERLVTTLSISDLTLSPVTTAGTQTIHIEGDTSQMINIDVGPLVDLVRAINRQGGICSAGSVGIPGWCTGTGDVTITYQANPVTGVGLRDDLNGTDVAVTASTSDGGSATATVRVRYQSDVKLAAATYSAVTNNTTEWLYFRWAADGPDPAVNPVVRIPGLGVECRYNAGPCTPMRPDYLIQLPISVCQVFKPLDLYISSDSDDPNPSNNTIHIDPFSGSPALLGCAPSDSGNGAGSGSGGGTPGGGGAAPTTAMASTTPPTARAETSSSAGGPTATTDILATSAPSHAARPVSDGGGLSWGWLAAGVAIVAAGILAGLGGWRWRRRRAGTQSS